MHERNCRFVGTLFIFVLSTILVQESKGESWRRPFLLSLTKLLETRDSKADFIDSFIR